MLKTIARRLGIALAVPIAAYLVAHLGDFFGIAWRATGPERNQFLVVGAMVFTAIFGVVGGWQGFCSFLDLSAKEVIWKEPRNFPMRTSFFICACWMYGVVALPNARYGPSPYHWFDNDAWIVLPMLAFVPLAVGLAALGIEWVQRIPSDESVGIKRGGDRP